MDLKGWLGGSLFGIVGYSSGGRIGEDSGTPSMYTLFGVIMELDDNFH